MTNKDNDTPKEKENTSAPWKGGGVMASQSVGDLIQLAHSQPPQPVLTGLMHPGDVVLLHGKEESFKSVFVFQLAESLAFGASFLGLWEVPKTRRVGVIETEMHPYQLGTRLKQMFPQGAPPGHLVVWDETALKKFRRARGIPEKLKLVGEWASQEALDILIIDTANDFFRGKDSPNEETAAGGFFDGLRNMGLRVVFIVRHDRKDKGDNYVADSSNENIRGSAEWKEDPETIFHLHRRDKRIGEVNFEVGKMRYGTKPEPLTLWFDAGTFRLTPVPPPLVILAAVNQMSREELLGECKRRFNIGKTKVEKLLTDHAPVLTQIKDKHKKIYIINPEGINEEWPWAPALRELIGVRVGDTERSAA